MDIYEALLTATTLFLFGFFLLVHFRQRRRSIPATFRGFCQQENPLAGLLEQSCLVDLADGAQVMAKASCCTICQGRFAVGDQVRLNRIDGEYYLDLPMVGQRDACQAGRSC